MRQVTYITKGQVNSQCALFNVVVKTALSPLGVCLCGYQQSNRSLVKDCGAPPPPVMSSGLHLSNAELCLFDQASCKL